MPTALKITQKTILTIAEAAGMTPAAVTSVYENYNNLDQVGYSVLDYVCEHGCPHEPVTMDEATFNTDFMFVTTPSETEFTEVITI